jgi:hypothetical protein
MTKCRSLASLGMTAALGAVLLSGCNYEMTGLDFGDCFFTCGGVPLNPAVAYGLAPDSARILLGDTITYYTYSCPAGSACTVGNVASYWSLPDAATAELVSPAPGSVSATSTVVLRGVAVGATSIGARHTTDSLLSRSARLEIVDSSAVAFVDLSTALLESDPVSLSGTRYIPAQLRTATGAPVRGRPTSWSISDTTVATLSPPQWAQGFEYRLLQPKKPGSVEVRSHFRDVVGVLRLTVR